MPSKYKQAMDAVQPGAELLGRLYGLEKRGAAGLRLVTAGETALDRPFQPEAARAPAGRRRPGRRMALCAAAAVAVITAGAILLTLLPQRGGVLPGLNSGQTTGGETAPALLTTAGETLPRTAAVPAIPDSRDYEEYVRTLDRLGLRHEKIKMAADAELENGRIVMVKPEAGVEIDPDTVVYVYVQDLSDSSDMTVPDVVGAARVDEAIGAVAGAGLAVDRSKIVYKNVRGKQEGTVVEQSPKAGETAPAGTEVMLTVATGYQDVSMAYDTFIPQDYTNKIQFEFYINGRLWLTTDELMISSDFNQTLTLNVNSYANKNLELISKQYKLQVHVKLIGQTEFKIFKEFTVEADSMKQGMIDQIGSDFAITIPS